MGSERRLTPPARVITIEITEAKIGRWMKYREITAVDHYRARAAAPEPLAVRLVQGLLAPVR